MGALALLPWGTIAKGIGILLVLGAGYWAWEHYVADPYIEKGVAQEKVHTDAAEARATAAEAANKTLDADLSALKIRVRDQNDSIAALDKQVIAATAAKLTALVALSAERASHQSAIDQLTAQAAGPPSPTKELACEKATATLSDLAARQLRD